MNKKGSVIDVVFFAVLLFALAIFIIFGYKLMSTINTEFQANDDLSSNAKGHMSDLKGKFVNLFDGIFFAFMIFLAIAMAVGAYYLELHPVFYVPSLLVILFTLIIAGAFANAFDEFTSDSDFTAEAHEFTLIPFILDNYVMFVMIVAFLLVIFMYAKNRNTEGL